MDYQKILEDIYKEILPFSSEGKQADYIPALAKVDPDQFGMCLQTVKSIRICRLTPDSRYRVSQRFLRWPCVFP